MMAVSYEVGATGRIAILQPQRRRRRPRFGRKFSTRGSRARASTGLHPGPADSCRRVSFSTETNTPTSAPRRVMRRGPFLMAARSISLKCVLAARAGQVSEMHLT
jgi:hypothetical protein